MNTQLNAVEAKLEQIRQLHAPAYYALVRRESSYGGWITEAMYLGEQPPTGREHDFVLCSVCHSNAIQEDADMGYYYGHTGSYPCETVQVIQR